jgi:uncharacterized membrane protein YecN with MAPEG domain
MVPVTSALVVLFGALITALAINATRQRIAAARARGDAARDAAKEAVNRASRAHGNTLEHALPLLLVLLCAELNGGTRPWLVTLGALFVAARLFYVYGMITRPVSPPMRFGAGLTYVVEIVALSYLTSLLCAC